jgi:hypothetical protein
MSEREKKYWYGVKCEYVCNLCCITTIDLAAMHSSTRDMNLLKTCVDRQSLKCHYCDIPIAIGTDIDVNIVSGTLEQLRSEGYPVPPA